MQQLTKTGLIKPKKLNIGDRVVAISLSAGLPFLFPKRFDIGCQQFSKEFGIEVIPSRHALKDPAWLSSNPRARADDLIETLEDPSVKGIICSIGGEDSIRVNGYVNKEIIRKNPKVFMGYSDATTTHFSFLNAGIVSFYGPTIMAGFGENGGVHEYMKNGVMNSVFSSNSLHKIPTNRDGWTTEFLDWANPDNQSIKRKLNSPLDVKCLQGDGFIEGHLIGGCAEVLEMLKGTTQWPDKKWFKNAILFLETAEKEFLPIHLARMIRSYGVMGLLDGLSGILIGRPGGNLYVEEFDKYYDSLLQVVRYEFGLKNLPIIANMDFGHTDPITTLPYGTQTKVDVRSGEITILENAVTD